MDGDSLKPEDQINPKKVLGSTGVQVTVGLLAARIWLKLVDHAADSVIKTVQREAPRAISKVLVTAWKN